MFYKLIIISNIKVLTNTFFEVLLFCAVSCLKFPIFLQSRRGRHFINRRWQPAGALQKTNHRSIYRLDGWF
jgi:hypothetical protein